MLFSCLLDGICAMTDKLIELLKKEGIDEASKIDLRDAATIIASLTRKNVEEESFTGVVNDLKRAHASREKQNAALPPFLQNEVGGVLVHDTMAKAMNDILSKKDGGKVPGADESRSSGAITADSEMAAKHGESGKATGDENEKSAGGATKKESKITKGKGKGAYTQSLTTLKDAVGKKQKLAELEQRAAQVLGSGSGLKRLKSSSFKEPDTGEKTVLMQQGTNPLLQMTTGDAKMSSNNKESPRSTKSNASPHVGKVGTHTIEADGLPNPKGKAGCVGKDGDLFSAVMSRVGSTSSIRYEPELNLRHLRSNYCGRTGIAGFSGDKIGVLTAEVSTPYMMYQFDDEGNRHVETAEFVIAFHNAKPYQMTSRRCAWPKRVEVIRPITAMMGQSTEFIAPSGELTKHLTAYRKADYRAVVCQVVTDEGDAVSGGADVDAVMSILHNRMKVQEQGRSVSDISGISCLVHSICIGLTDAESTMDVLDFPTKQVQLRFDDEMEGDLSYVANADHAQDVARLYLGSKLGAEVLTFSTETVVLIVNSIDELKALSILAAVSCKAGKRSIVFGKKSLKLGDEPKCNLKVHDGVEAVRQKPEIFLQASLFGISFPIDGRCCHNLAPGQRCS